MHSHAGDNVSQTSQVLIREANLADLQALVALETECFEGDRVSRRRLRHWITADNGCLLIAEHSGNLCGYGLTLYRKNSHKARIYSLAVAGQARGVGVAADLLRGLEADAGERGCSFIQLEVSSLNIGAIHLYTKAGYQPFGLYDAYYEDGSDALRLNKPLQRP